MRSSALRSSNRRSAAAFGRYAAAGQLRMDDPRKAASFFNWLVMGGPANDAMLLGDTAIPDAATLEAHAREAVRIFLAAYDSDAR
jgi:TetR/AcrR family transcriptional regulator, mexJK operon transcriptional repressor